MAFVLSGSVTGTTRLCYNNLLENGTVTASSEAVGFAVSNAYNWLTNDYYKPTTGGTTTIDLTLTTGAPADYFAFYGTDLGSLSGTIKLQYHNGATYVDAFTAQGVFGTEPFIKFFDSKTSDKWRVVITSTGVFAIASIAFGEYIALEHGLHVGFTEPKLARETETIGNISDGGVFLGRSIISKGFRTRMNIEFMSETFTRDKWLPFVRHAEKKPFYLAWDYDRYPNEAAFCWTDGDISKLNRTQKRLFSTNFKIMGLIE